MKKHLKAFEDLNFINSNEARSIRILSEYLEPAKRLEENNIKNTVVFFGSARISPDKNSSDKLSEYYWKAEEMAYKLGNLSKEMDETDHSFTLCTGGGPGIMEAANRGANRSGVKSIGLNIEIPHEQEPNKYISEKLSFEFHYFFMRKLWFMCHAKAIIVFPGGFGTMDEMFEILTLIQTNKLGKPNFSVLLYNEEYWKEIINFKRLAELKMISKKDMELFHFFSSVDEGINYLKPRLIQSMKNNNNCI